MMLRYCYINILHWMLLVCLFSADPRDGEDLVVQDAEGRGMNKSGMMAEAQVAISLIPFADRMNT